MKDDARPGLRHKHTTGMCYVRFTIHFAPPVSWRVLLEKEWQKLMKASFQYTDCHVTLWLVFRVIITLPCSEFILP